MFTIKKRFKVIKFDWELPIPQYKSRTTGYISNMDLPGKEIVPRDKFTYGEHKFSRYNTFSEMTD